MALRVDSVLAIEQCLCEYLATCSVEYASCLCPSQEIGLEADRKKPRLAISRATSVSRPLRQVEKWY